jgi:hypothetical protein
MSQKISFEQIIERGCGMDVHKSLLVARYAAPG